MFPRWTRVSINRLHAGKHHPHPSGMVPSNRFASDFDRNMWGYRKLPVSGRRNCGLADPSDRVNAPLGESSAAVSFMEKRAGQLTPCEPRRTLAISRLNSYRSVRRQSKLTHPDSGNRGLTIKQRPASTMWVENRPASLRCQIRRPDVVLVRTPAAPTFPSAADSACP